jgi:hypothetical protein
LCNCDPAEYITEEEGYTFVEDLTEADLNDLEQLVADAEMKKPQAKRFLKAVAAWRDTAAAAAAAGGGAGPDDGDRKDQAATEALRTQQAELEQQRAALAQEQQALQAEREAADARRQAEEEEVASVALALRLQREEQAQLAQTSFSNPTSTTVEAQPEPEPQVGENCGSNRRRGGQSCQHSQIG